jgi:peptidyl-dipeptidase Dcp
MRQKLWEASAYRGLGEDGGIDNRPVLMELVELRAERAGCWDTTTFAHFALEPQTGRIRNACSKC